MLSYQELIGEVYNIKVKSEELSSMVAAANVNLSSQVSIIANIVRGSHTGQDAVMSLGVAVRSLSEASAVMKTLSRTCDDCINNLSK